MAHAIKLAPKLAKDQIILVNLSGRGDKDVQQAPSLFLVGRARPWPIVESRDGCLQKPDSLADRPNSGG